jgi:hypothetical protein
MPIDVEVDRKHGWVTITHRGAADTMEMKAAQAKALALLLEKKLRRVLLDVSGTSVDPSLTSLFDAASNVGTNPASTAIAALLVRADQAENARFVETVATNRGVSMRTFTDRDAAMKWLMEN